MVIERERKKYYVFAKNWLVGGWFLLLKGGDDTRCIGVLLNIRCFMLDIQRELMFYVLWMLDFQ